MRNAVLGLLAKAPAHGYELKRLIDRDFADLWGELNIGQIYTTLRRLERDGLVVEEAVLRQGRRERRVFALTPAGHEAVGRWLDEPAPPPRIRDDLFTKILLARRLGAGDPLGMIDRQRRAYLRELRGLQDLAENAAGLAAELAVEGAILHLQADLAWLERCEQAFATTREGST